MTFRELYEQELNKPKPLSPSQLFRARVAAAAHVDEASVYNWINGRATPRGATLELLAKYLGEDPETLFPNKQNEDKQ